MASGPTSKRIFTQEITDSDLDAVSEFCSRHTPLGETRASVRSSGTALFSLTIDGEIACIAGIDFSRRSIAGPWFRNSKLRNKLFGRAIASTEKLAAQYGMTLLKAYPADRAQNLFRKAGYAPVPRGKALVRNIERRTTRFGRTIQSIASELGIPDDYGVSHRLKLQPQATALRSIGKDVFDRTQKMMPRAATAWKKMVKQAKSDSVAVQAVSAFRSVEYQAGLVQRKLDKGQSMNEILAVSAAPGYSEHHTGCAIDVTTPGFEVLEEEFEESGKRHHPAKEITG